MNHKKTLIALAVIMLAAIPVSILLSEVSDAQVIVDDNNISGNFSSDRSDGTLVVPLRNTESNDQPVTITVTDSSGKVVATNRVIVPGDNITFNATLSFRMGAGSHDLTVTCVADNPVFVIPGPGGTTTTTDTHVSTITISVTQSVLSKTSTYAAIAIVVILIVLGVYLYMRNAPTKKPETTFTELERQKKENKGVPEETSRSSATERKKYKESGSRPKEPAEKKPAPAEKKPAKAEKKAASEEKKPAKAEPKAAPVEKKTAPAEKKPAPEEKKPAPAEKKATTFTELEKQKQEKKDSSPPAKKDSSSEEPKKLKYVSSRRK
ncbi:MAG: hypothetical protein FWF07_01010 [Methanomassiliicoccaceae archaeon]|nr:hypothetical protein [Methanomassiliicoccaceae archaeon]